MLQRHPLPAENEEVRQAEAKLMHRLYAVAVRVVADERGKVERVCEAFHQFHYNNIVCRIKRLDEKMLERIRRREVEHLGIFFRDKRLPVLTPKELAALVNVPRPVPSLPVRLGIAVLEPPPELVKIGELPGEAALGADPDLLAEILESVEVMVLAPTAVETEARGETSKKEETEATGEKPVLERIRERLSQLLEEGLAFRKREFIAVTSEAAKRLGYQSLSQLYSELRNSGVEAAYRTVWYRGRSVRVVTLPAKLLEQR